MAGKKTETSEATEETKAVAVATGGGAIATTEVPDFMDLGSYDGAGFEGADAESYAIPFIQVLQKMSPQVDEDDPKYIEGAKAGMFLNTVTGKIYDGKTGLQIIPAAYRREFIRWAGREAEGGFKGAISVEDFKEMMKDPTKVKEVEGRLYAPNEDGSVSDKKSDYFADTRGHYVIVIDPDTGDFGQALISLSSSQIKASKKLMTALSQKKVQTPQGLRTPPTFANLVRMTTVGMSNDKGSWSGVQFELEGLVKNPDHFKAAADLYKSFVGGEVKVDYSKQEQPRSDAGGVGDATEAEEF
ncbi:putative holin [Pseudomonas phage phiLCL12]|nr:putative holin [Pseudomonas phage phiLCL12]